MYISGQRGMMYQVAVYVVSKRFHSKQALQWAPAFKKYPVKKARLDLSEKKRSSVWERQLELGNKIRISHIRNRRFRLPLKSYSTDEGATVGAWVLLEAGGQGGWGRWDGRWLPMFATRSFQLRGGEFFRVYPRCVMLQCTTAVLCTMCM